MEMRNLFLAQLEAETKRTRRALERVPEGREDWKPHQKSMPLGRLAMLVAQMPSWLAMIIHRDDLDLSPARRLERGSALVGHRRRIGSDS